MTFVAPSPVPPPLAAGRPGRAGGRAPTGRPRAAGGRGRWRAAARAVILPALLALGACSGSRADPAEPALRILYTADAQGYLEACACETGGMLGGIARRAALVDSLQVADPAALLVEAGDFATSPGAHGERVGIAAARAMDRMGYDAVLPGEVELNLSPEWWRAIAGLELPFVHTNFGTPELGPPDPEPLVLERGGRRVAVLGLLGADLYLLPETRERARVLPPVAAAGEALRRLEGRDVDAVLALVHARDAVIDALAAAHPRIDVIVAGHTAKNLEQPERRGATLVVTAGFLGQHLGDLELRGRTPETARNRLIRLETSLPEDPEVARWAAIAAGSPTP